MRGETKVESGRHRRPDRKKSLPFLRVVVKGKKILSPNHYLREAKKKTSYFTRTI